MDASVYTRIKLGEKEYKGDFIFGFAGNTLSVGGMNNIVPDGAQMNDGLLDCMFIKTPKAFGALDRIRQALMTGKLDIPEIISAKSEKVELFMDRPVAWTLDGEYGGTTDCASIGIKNRAIKITVP